MSTPQDPVNERRRASCYSVEPFQDDIVEVETDTFPFAHGILPCPLFCRRASRRLKPARYAFIPYNPNHAERALHPSTSLGVP